ncbi:MAG: Tat pathway signal protein [Ignavibacteriae bacterium]|nr:Tat pathway signal protein [Ignavibacteriota bacterium]
MKTVLILLLLVTSSLASIAQSKKKHWDPFLDTLQRRTIQWFLDVTPKETGLTPDRWPAEWSPSSIAAVGFALTIYPIAVERKMISRREAAERTLNTLRFFWKSKQSPDATDVSGHKGFYYHFLKKNSGLREWNCELSTVDTGLLIMGALFAQSYFTKATPDEREIRNLADSLYRRIDWTYFTQASPAMSMGWTPEDGFNRSTWNGYMEAQYLYIIALASPTHPLMYASYEHWLSGYLWKEHYGQTLVNFMPLFGHQHSHCWIDFRGIRDSFMRVKGIDYFENSRRATYLHRTYAIQNPHQWIDYSDSIWGLSACDGPKDTTFEVRGKRRLFRSYSARGTGAEEEVDDGTIAPNAAAGCVPFAPEIVVPALKAMKNKYGDKLWTKYGFVDAFNPTYITDKTPSGWFDSDYLGLDQGPIAIMIENYRNGFVWNVMKKNKYIVDGLKRAKFTGGWLDRKH